MSERIIKRPAMITFAAVLVFIQAAFLTLIGITTFADASWLSEYRQALGSGMWLSALIDFALAIGLVIAGYSLLKGNQFGLYFSFAFAGMNAIKWFFFMFWFPVMGIVSIAIDGLIIYALAVGADYFDEYSRLGIG